jgi:hypothetical protein
VVVASVEQEVAGGLVSRPALHGSVESAGSGERGEVAGAGGELLLLLEALLHGLGARRSAASSCAMRSHLGQVLAVASMCCCSRASSSAAAASGAVIPPAHRAAA